MRSTFKSARLAAAIGAGGELPALLAELQACEATRAKVEGDRVALVDLAQVSVRDIGRNGAGDPTADWTTGAAC
jgi:hypothetical protein